MQAKPLTMPPKPRRKRPSKGERKRRKKAKAEAEAKANEPKPTPETKPATNQAMRDFIRHSLKLSGETTTIKVTPCQGALPKKCFSNCHGVPNYEKTLCWNIEKKDEIGRRLSRYMGKPIKVPAGSFSAELHCVLKRDGKLIDITPFEAGVAETTRTIAIEPRVTVDQVIEYLTSLKEANCFDNIRSPALKKFMEIKGPLDFFKIFLG